MSTCTCMAESVCYPPETITTLLISYTPIKNKKFKRNIEISLSQLSRRHLLYKCPVISIIIKTLYNLSHLVFIGPLACEKQDLKEVKQHPKLPQ